MNRILQAIVLVVIVCIYVFVYFTWETKQHISPPPPVRQYIFMATGSSGRLGNLMFQYASLIGTAHTNQAVPVVVDSSHLLDVFQLTAVKSPDLKNTLGMYKHYSEFDSKANTYDANVTLFRKQLYSVLFSGYYQSWKYFEKVPNLVRKEFTFCDAVLNHAKDIHSRVHIGQGFSAIDNLTIVGIHVRRGDMLEGYKAGYTVPGTYYYEVAMNFFMNVYKNVKFIVCTDDQNWSIEKIIGDNVYYSTSNSEGVDMDVLSMCHHVIVSVGTFGWWGAWLANGTTIYYSQWPRVGSQLEKQVTKEDYFFNNWIPLP